MVTIGIDAHKRTHTAVACDAQGRELARRSAGATSASHLELIAWARTLDRERCFAVETPSRRECRHSVGTAELVNALCRIQSHNASHQRPHAPVPMPRCLAPDAGQ